MTILLVNDDGYEAEGIRVLEEVLVAAGHEVWVCAPSSQRSASSHGMTLGRDVTATSFGANHWHVDGFPSDCILYGLRGGLFPLSPDLVVSGINHGYNISTDILYSGTIGAASEAALAGIPAIAISCQKKGDGGVFPFEKAARFLVEHLTSFLPLCGKESFVNINVPPESDGKRWAASNLSRLYYDDVVLKGSTSSTRTFDHPHFGSSILLRLSGGRASQQEEEKESDFHRMEEGLISVTVLGVLPRVDETRQALLRLLEKSSNT